MTGWWSPIKVIEVVIVMLGLLYLAFESVSSNFMAPYSNRADIVTAGYCILFVIYSVMRLKPTSKKDIGQNVLIVLVGQLIADVTYVSYGRPLHDLTILEWVISRLPFILIITAIGAAIVQFLIYLVSKKWTALKPRA